MLVAQSTRLNLRHIQADDAEFILLLLNDPDFVKYVGDKQVRDLDAAQDYIQEGPASSYKTHGYGLYLVELIDSHQAIGICGLLKRDFLEQADLGFALMPGYRGNGYAFEAAQSTIELARNILNLSKIVAFTANNNMHSIKLLEKLGMKFDKMMSLPGADKSVKLFNLDL
jgi:RimJ/RimL family protein N-acetyltransferase